MTPTLRLDLHVHCVNSPDSGLRVETVIERLGIVGLNGFALTDHNTTAGHGRLRELAREYPRLLLVPGVEVSTVEGHLLVYGVSEPPPPHRPLSDTLDWVKERAAVAVLAHPFRWSHGVGRRIADLARVDGIEGINGHNSELANARAHLLATRRGLSATGGSDAHHAMGVGRAYTEVSPEVADVDDLLRELRSGRAQPAGRSLTGFDRVRLGVRTGLLRATRGFRPI
ncbi:MAG: PHP domain-containing protein [Thermoplasmata archaeon]|nr:PHP domain-containing protein [Thermoplasmata archaeon]